MSAKRNVIRLLVTAFLACGCFSQSSAKDRHADFYGCSSADVTTEEVEAQGHTRVRTVGCGHEELFSCIGAKCRSPRILALKLFSDDATCPVGQSSAVEEAQGTWALSGCGKSMKYRCREVPNEVVRCDPIP